MTSLPKANTTLIKIAVVVAVLLLGSITAMVYIKGYPWTCGQATAEDEKAIAEGVAASEALAANPLDSDRKYKFDAELEQLKRANEAKKRLCE